MADVIEVLGCPLGESEVKALNAVLSDKAAGGALLKILNEQKHLAAHACAKPALDDADIHRKQGEYAMAERISTIKEALEIALK